MKYESNGVPTDGNGWDPHDPFTCDPMCGVCLCQMSSYYSFILDHDEERWQAAVEAAKRNHR